MARVRWIEGHALWLARRRTDNLLISSDAGYQRRLDKATTRRAQEAEKEANKQKKEAREQKKRNKRLAAQSAARDEELRERVTHPPDDQPGLYDPPSLANPHPLVSKLSSTIAGKRRSAAYLARLVNENAEDPTMHDLASAQLINICHLVDKSKKQYMNEMREFLTEKGIEYFISLFSAELEAGEEEFLKNDDE